MEAIIPILVNALLPAGGTILTALVSWGMVAVTKYVKTKTKNEAVNDAVSHICHTVETTVKEVEQKYVPKYKQLQAGGMHPADAAKQLKDIALERVKNQLPAAIAITANLAVNSVDGFIAAKIEKAVFDMKSSRLTAVISETVKE